MDLPTTHCSPSLCLIQLHFDASQSEDCIIFECICSTLLNRYFVFGSCYRTSLTMLLPLNLPKREITQPLIALIVATYQMLKQNRVPPDRVLKSIPRKLNKYGIRASHLLVETQEGMIWCINRDPSDRGY